MAELVAFSSLLVIQHMNVWSVKDMQRVQAFMKQRVTVSMWLLMLETLYQLPKQFGSNITNLKSLLLQMTTIGLKEIQV